MKSRLLISAPKRSSGKTTLSVGISYALQTQGFNIQTFKKGPDFIDPMWLAAASKRGCYNLDHFLMGENNILSTFMTYSKNSDLSLIEGNMGLHDAMSVDGTGSSAHLARQLKAPVILVIDAHGMNRGIAPLVLGHQLFDQEVNICGVILNKVRGKRHEEKLIESIKTYCSLDVIGAIPSVESLSIKERHLGLVPIEEDNSLSSILHPLKEVVNKYINLNSLIEIAHTAPPLDESLIIKESPPINTCLKLGVAKDHAFHFYYNENIHALEQEGIEIVYFSPLYDEKLPNVDGLYIGGGFPEIFMDQLQENISMRKEIKKAIDSGMPIYAECGGLMYLAKTIEWNGVKREMVGGIPCDIMQTPHPIGKGYAILKTTEKNNWYPPFKEINAHEFHYSKIANLESVSFAYQVARGYGVDGEHDGILYKNVLASYSHLHTFSSPHWVKSFSKKLKDSF